MVLVGGLFAFGLVLAIAAFVVTREAGRLAKEPPPPLFSMDEALEWIVAKLPDIVAATLTEADVRRILDFQIEFFQRKGVAGNGSTAKPKGDVVVGGSETVEYILERAKETGEEYLPEQVYSVVETQFAYLRAIGAVGPRTAGPKPGDDPGRT